MQIIALLVLIIDTCCCLPESLGRSFIFGFIRDSNLDVDNQVLSITVLNGGDQDCHFNLTYRDDYSMSTPPRTTSFVVSKGMTEIPVPSWYGWQYDTPGMQVESGPNQLLTGASSCDVTVIANNYDQSTHQGDSFLELWLAAFAIGSVPIKLWNQTVSSSACLDMVFQCLKNFESILYLPEPLLKHDQ
ncbi:hypothetical protein V3C99_008319 [Haemonchus contortus]